MRVRLLDVTPKALEIIYAACRQCYSPDFAGDIFDGATDKEKVSKFIDHVVASGHESPLEHVKFTFAIEGISRACSHQLVRHRIASFSQQSQRYVKEDKFDYVVPVTISNNQATLEIFEDTMAYVQDAYNTILSLLNEDGKKGELANQDARYLLPNAVETKIVVTMNCRELINFFKQRCCTRAQWEIRELATNMLTICKHELPEIFEYAGEKCKSLGYCPEGPKFCCGKYKPKE